MKKILLIMFVALIALSSITVVSASQGYIEHNGVQASIAGGINYDEDALGLNQQMVYNGEEFSVNVNPEQARERVNDRLMNAEMIGNPEVKPVMINNRERLVYEFKVQQKARVINLFNVNVESIVNVPVDSGEVNVKNPWWSFITNIDEE